MNSVSLFNPTCSACGKRMGEMTADEFSHLVIEEGLEAKCFDCDHGEANNVHQIFYDTLPGDRLRLSGYETITIGPRSHAHERARAHSFLTINSKGLSSVTYLNTAKHNDGLSVNGVEYGSCPVCGGETGWYENVMHDACFECGGVGLIEVAIYLPKWLLGLGCENA